MVKRHCYILFKAILLRLAGVVLLACKRCFMPVVECFSNASDGPVILVHGGAWDIPDVECEAHRVGLENALETGKKGVMAGRSALEIAADVVASMESDGAFDAGHGAVLNGAGEVELDAGIMDGKSRHFGAVAGIRHYENPVKIALQIIEKGGRQFCFLAGDGAESFARQEGFRRVANDRLICEREKIRYTVLQDASGYHTSHPFLPGEEHPRGTVGCVVRGPDGRLAAATSTGGTPFRPAGRIGDSPLPGCGYYASNAGAASATGWGEAIASVSLCYEAVRLLENHPVDEAAVRVIRDMESIVRNQDGQGATGGIILLNAAGEGAIAYSTPRMARGGWSSEQQNCRI